DDVFGSAPPSPGADRTVHQPTDPSDIPRLRSTHVTNGYREGISASKSTHIQEGFDEGYALGAELGLRVGWCMGVLRGVLHAVSSSHSNTSATPSVPAAENAKLTSSITRESVQQIIQDAEEALTIQALFGKDFFGEDGIWLYDVPGQESGDEGSVTFALIADAHPLLTRWMTTIREVA
ncbi:hypothetical protein BDY17DRAFT_238911, partial [Neohortaea acidophila]